MTSTVTRNWFAGLDCKYTALATPSKQVGVQEPDGTWLFHNGQSQALQDEAPEWQCNSDRYEADVQYGVVNERCANIFWRGTTPVDDDKQYVADKERNLHIITLGYLEAYAAQDKYGNLLLRHWVSDNANVTVRVRDGQYGEVVLECFTNYKDTTGRWTGKRQVTVTQRMRDRGNHVERDVMTEAGQLLAKYSNPAGLTNSKLDKQLLKDYPDLLALASK